MRVEDQEGEFSVSDEGALIPGRLPLMLLAVMVRVGCAGPLCLRRNSRSRNQPNATLS